MMLFSRIYLIVLLAGSAAGSAASAAYYNPPESDIDPAIFSIDEEKFLGARISETYELLDEKGRAFSFGDMLEDGKPLILVLSYYTCDGSCSVINSDLRDRLAETGRVRQGQDFRILTLSFDKKDNPKTAAEFRRHLEMSGQVGEGWTFATFKDPDDIKALTGRVGFKYFWSPADRTFFHPGVFMFLSDKGRLIRVLYALSSGPGDLELAVFDAKQGQFRPSEIVNFATSLCYSYNYKEGRYTYNIPLFVALGSLTLGVSLFAGFIMAYRRRIKREKI